MTPLPDPTQADRGRRLRIAALRGAMALLVVASRPDAAAAAIGQSRPAGGAGQGRPADGGGDAERRFDLPAQPLDTALTAYFRLTGVQLLYDSSITAGRRSAPVRGTFSSREALRRLLAGTGLVARYSRERAATIVPESQRIAQPLVSIGRIVVRERAPIPLGPPASNRFRLYYLALESELHALVEAHPRLSRETFAATAVLSIAPDGEIRTLKAGTEEAGASGGRRARMLAEALVGRTVSPPPADLPQPLRVRLRGTR